MNASGDYIDIISIVSSILGTIFSVMFVFNLLFFGIVTGILAKLLGAEDLFDGGTAGAINYLISTFGMGILASIMGAMSPLALLAIVYGISALVILRLTGLDIIKSIIVAVGASYLVPLVFPTVVSLLDYF